MKEKISTEINLSKEVFQSLPANNSKNRKKFLTEIEKEIAHYQEELNEIYQELENRVKPYQELEESHYDDYESVFIELSKAMSYTNNLSTAYEKLKLDKNIYYLSHNQVNNLKQINQNLRRMIAVFHKAGIPLESKDFGYTKFVQWYMEFFFSKSASDHSAVEKKFEEIYWKDPHLILELELNMRHLYVKHQKQLEKYVNKVTHELLSHFEKGEKNLIDDYAFLRRKLEKTKLEDKNNLLYRFTKGEYHVEDYSIDKMDSLLTTYFGESGNNKSDEEIMQDTIKLLHSLEEYQKCLKYDSFIQKMKKLYQDPQEKDAFSKQMKKIQELEKKLFKLNKKSTHSATKTKVDELEPEINQVIQEIHEQYQEIDHLMFQYVLKKNMKDNSTIFKAFLLLNQYYSFFADACLEKNAQLTFQEIDQQQKEFAYFILDPDNTMINNITLVDSLKISDVVISNYRLLGVQMTEAMLEPANLDNCMSDLRKLIIYYQLKNMNISLETLDNNNKILKMIENHQKAI